MHCKLFNYNEIICSSLLLYQTSHDLLKELCGMLDLKDESDIEEFGIYADLGKRKSITYNYCLIIY